MSILLLADHITTIVLQKSKKPKKVNPSVLMYFLYVAIACGLLFPIHTLLSFPTYSASKNIFSCYFATHEKQFISNGLRDHRRQKTKNKNLHLRISINAWERAVTERLSAFQLYFPSTAVIP